MGQFYDDIAVDNIVLLDGYEVKKAESNAKNPNINFILVFNRLYYEKVNKSVKIVSLKDNPVGFYHGQIFSNVIIKKIFYFFLKLI